MSLITISAGTTFAIPAEYADSTGSPASSGDSFRKKRAVFCTIGTLKKKISKQTHFFLYNHCIILPVINSPKYIDMSI